MRALSLSLSLSLSWTDLDKLQLEVLGHLVGLADSEDVGDYVMRGIPLVPEALEDEVGTVDVGAHTVGQHLLDQQWVGLITHLQ